MNLADERLKGLENALLAPDESALLRCRVAADLLDAGRYEAARDSLGELWSGIGLRPNVEGLGARASAEVLLLAGVLSGRLGASRQRRDAQEAAKDLISESISLFESLGGGALAAAAPSG